MPLVDPSGLQNPGAASTAGGTNTTAGADTTAATAWIQQQPWYKQTLASWGNPKTLSLGQRGYLARTAQQAGLNSDFGINTDGTVEDWSTPTGAKIALAAVAALGGGAALGVFGAGASGASAIPATEGIASATSLGLPTTAGLGTAGTIAGGASTAAGAASGLPDWLSLAKDLGPQLSSLSAGRAQGRNYDNLANIGFAQAQNDLYNSELKAPQQVASNAVRGDILSNAKDVSFGNVPSDIPVPQISGGLRPSMFSDTTRQLGKNITANAAATPMPTPTPPVLQPMETSGVGDDILNGASMVANFAPALSKIPWGKIF